MNITNITPINSEFLHYTAYDKNNCRILFDDRKIDRIEVSKHCINVANELLSRLANTDDAIIHITMKKSRHDVSIEIFEDFYHVNSLAYKTPLVLSNIYAVADAIIHYEDDIAIQALENQLLAEFPNEADYDDGLFDEYLITLRG